jgi:hypothetical protein
VLTQAWDEFKEKVGAQLLKAMPAITGAITSLLNAFNSLSPGMQKAVVIGGALAAVLGPVLVALGSLVTISAPLIAAVGSIGSAMGVMAAASAGFTGLAAAIAPVAIPLAAIAAAGVLIYTQWDKIAPVLERVGRAVVAAIGPAVANLVDAFRDAFNELMNGPLGPALRALAPILEKVGSVIARVMGSVIVTSIVSAAQVIGVAIEGIAIVVRGLSATFNLVFGEIPRFVARMVAAVTDWLGPKLRAAFAPALATIELTRKAFHGLYDAVVGHSYIPDMVDGIAAQMARLDAVMVNPVKGATAKATQAFKDMAAEVRPLLDRLFPEAAALASFNKDFGTIERARGVLGRDTTNSALDALQNERFAGRADNDNPAISDMAAPMELPNLTAQLAALGDTIAASVPKISGLSVTFDNLGISGEELKTDLARAFTDVILGAKSFGDALRGVFNRLASKILDNMFEKLLGNVLGSVIPGFATGTRFAPGGMALVGERGPEIVNLPRGSQVIPNHELRGMGGQVHSPSFYFPGITNAKEAREAGGQAARRYRQEINGPLRRAS